MTDGPLTYLLLISSFICSAMSKSGRPLCPSGGLPPPDCGFDIDFRMASSFVFEGDILAFMLDGDRGISGDTVFDPGAILLQY